MTITTPEEARALGHHLLDRTRTRPVCVVSIADQATRPYIDIDEVVRELGELCEYYLIPTGRLTFALADQLPEAAGVYGGAGRIYGPAEEWTGNPFTGSPLVMCTEEARGPAATEWLIQRGLRFGSTSTSTVAPTSEHRTFTVKQLSPPSRALAVDTDGQPALLWRSRSCPASTSSRWWSPASRLRAGWSPARGGSLPLRHPGQAWRISMRMPWDRSSWSARLRFWPIGRTSTWPPGCGPCCTGTTSRAIVVRTGFLLDVFGFVLLIDYRYDRSELAARELQAQPVPQPWLDAHPDVPAPLSRQAAALPAVTSDEGFGAVIDSRIAHIEHLLEG